MLQHLTVSTNGQGLYEITHDISSLLGRASQGLCHLFVQHTSCSLTIQENADPSAKLDLENWLNRLVPEGDPLYTHVFEGPDDITAHIKSMLTQTEMSVPIVNGKLALGTWQGIYLWEHRHQPQERKIVVTLMSN